MIETVLAISLALAGALCTIAYRHHRDYARWGYKLGVFLGGIAFCFYCGRTASEHTQELILKPGVKMTADSIDQVIHYQEFLNLGIIVVGAFAMLSLALLLLPNLIDLDHEKKG